MSVSFGTCREHMMKGRCERVCMSVVMYVCFGMACTECATVLASGVLNAYIQRIVTILMGRGTTQGVRGA